MKIYFIGGIDTAVGKTTIACQLLRQYASEDQRVLGFKPIASGAERRGSQWVNEDALALQTASNMDCPYAMINPYCFAAPIAPHLAAREQNVDLNVANLLRHTDTLLSLSPDVCIIEGAGGWLLPLNDDETLADYVKALNIPVIVVVGMRLGCLNHTLLTIKAIEQADIGIEGWIANQIDPEMLAYHDNLTWLQQNLTIPLLAEVQYKKASA